MLLVENKNLDLVLATYGQESSPCLNFSQLIFAQGFLSPAGIPSPAFLLPFQFPKNQEALPNCILSHLTSQHRRSFGPLAESQAEKQLLGKQGRRGPEPSLYSPLSPAQLQAAGASCCLGLGQLRGAVNLLLGFSI